MPFNFDSNPLILDRSDWLSETSFLRNCTCTSFIVISTLSLALAASLSRWPICNRASCARVAGAEQKSNSASSADELPVVTGLVYIFSLPVLVSAARADPIRSFVVISAARLRRHAIAPDLHADLAEFAIVFRLVGRIGEAVESMEARSHALIRFKQILFTADAENLSAGLIGERLKLLVRERSVIRFLRKIPAEKSVKAPAPAACVKIDRIDRHISVISPPE